MKSYRQRIAEGNQFRNANGNFAPKKELDPNDRTLTFVLVNGSSTASATARIFGANQGLDETYNTSQGVTVTVNESSHLEVKTKSIQGGFRIQGIQMTATTSLQLANPLTIKEKTVAGTTIQRTWQPENYKDPRNYDNLMIKTSNFQMTVTGDSSIEVTLRPSETLRIITHIKDIVQPINKIKGESDVESADPYKSY